jgi:hypothetical protein
MQNSSPTLDRIGRILESPTTSKLFNFIIIPLLILLILLLPPVALLDRVQSFGYDTITAESGMITNSDGTKIIFPADGLTGKTKAKLSVIPREQLEAGKDVPAEQRKAWAKLAEYPGLRPKSPIYQIRVRGDIPSHSTLTLPIPNDSLPYETLDVYNWNGETWEWMPHKLLPEEDAIECDVNFVPHDVAIFQTTPIVPTTVGAILPAGKTLPVQASSAVSLIFSNALMLRGDGSFDGAENLIPADSINGKAFMLVRNYKPGEVPRTDLLANTITDAGLKSVQINTLAEFVATKNYNGVALDYRGADPMLRGTFSAFVDELATRLHKDGKELILFMDRPLQLSNEAWETFGYDWTALGAASDGVVLPTFENPVAYVPNGQAESLLSWAVGQVNRYKLLMAVPAHATEQAGNYFIPRSFQDAIAPIMGQVATDSDVVEPGSAVNAQLQSAIVASPLQTDTEKGLNWYRYRGQSGEERLVFIENAASLTTKLGIASKYNLAGVVTNAEEVGDYDPKIWNVLEQYVANQIPSTPEGTLVVDWKATDSQGNVVQEQQAPLSQAVQLVLPEAPDTYSISAEIKEGNEVISKQGAVQVAVATFTPVPTPTPQATPTPEASPPPTPLPYAVAIATGDTNLRQGPGTNYPRVGMLKQGEQLKIIGKNDAGNWWQLEGKDGKPVWIISSRVRTQGDTQTIAVAKDIPKPPARKTTSGGGGGHALPAGAGSFGYGIQIQPYGGADLGYAANAIKGMGFNWVKWQVPWKGMEGSQGNIGWGGQDNAINLFAGQGIHILASIVKAPDWARGPGADLSVEGPPANPATFADFLGKYAARYCGKVQAIEVWNEQNLHYEWGNEPLDPARYMQLLAAGYTAIKAACPQMIVVSGALTPAGNVGALAIDDQQYLEGMYQHGLKQYSDAIGIHPSGYNVPPNLTWQQACDYINQTGASFRGPCDSPHHSWSARSTVEQSRNVMLKYGDTNKRLWPTEFGWAVGPAVNSAYGYANDTSRDEQARWTVEFYQWMKSTGYVGTAILWNLNFSMTNPGTELMQWSIVDASGRPTQTYNALQAMPK